jgi:hypothetical protein
VEIADDGTAFAPRAKKIIAVESLEERNPSALRRTLELVSQ